MGQIKRAACGLLVAAFISTSILFTTTANAAEVTAFRAGSTGDQVIRLQRDLKALGYYSYGSITGYYGAITQYSVIKFQRANNLYADGIAGPVTMSKINQLLYGASLSTYTVEAGDSLWIISQKLGTTVDNLKAVNNLWSDSVYPGQVLKVTTQANYDVSAYVDMSESQNPDLYWLSRIIEAESSGETYTGKVAVGSVVMNRVVSPDFPSTVKGVIFEYYKNIPQFSPVADGTIYNTPSAESIRAALDAINGIKPAQNSTYFFNPDKSAAPWIVSNKTFVVRIGNHVFYK